MSYGSARKRALQYLINMLSSIPQPRWGCGATGRRWFISIVVFLIVVMAVVKLVVVGIAPAVALAVVGACGAVAATVIARLSASGPSTA